MKKQSIIKILILFLALSGCGNDIANKGGGNTNTNDNDTIIISSIASDSDLSKVAKCESCVLELEDQSECVCRATIQCTEEDIAGCIDCLQFLEICPFSESIEEEIPIDLGEDLSEGAL